ncbi:DNA polymerase III subunit alpha [bacterium endosymbiont of Pedicinus badii]|uniref:DNA polymerase III subunit alpha n=1 Tax=bacterium endosymbiont of Pedicinus badii TaxID=1719126 RepID=UPI0009BC2184|nr:DNA polymerase III subunit alpha [bacterium endosymbiont of Pedicinus badii]OQM33987.1 hypothetical protein AOQ89_01335 [bacterium endosymbiont of Pedicinus badii]
MSIKTKFIHLKIHTDYSMIDGLVKIEPAIKKVCSYQMPSLAITDFHSLSGWIKFYKQSIKNGIKPIVGVDFLIMGCIENNRDFEITLIAKNNTGYKNLILLISKAQIEGFSSTYKIQYSWLIKYKEGIIILSGSYKGEIADYIIKEKKISIKKYLSIFLKHFDNNFYIEITRIGKEIEEKYITSALELARIQGIPVVATNNVRFISSEDFEAHQVRIAIGNNISLQEVKKREKYTPQQYIKSQEEMQKLFFDIPEALENSVQIAKRCSVFMNFKDNFLPKFTYKNYSPEKLLYQLAHKGLKKRLSSLYSKNSIKKIKEKYIKRLNYEIKVINSMKFPSYFLIVMEFIIWAKKNGIPVGPGRGSGAGSLVAFCLYITDLDPIKFDLIFERFLNKERTSLPDFDIDFCVKKRDLVIEHVIKRYGKFSVAQIVTFGSLTAKSAIKDVGRILGYPYTMVDKISKMIPNDFGITISKALNTEKSFLELYQNDEEAKIIINMAKKIEGTIKNVGKHAGGIVISPTKITNFCPVYLDKDSNAIITQFDKQDIENIGLVKFDFLGLKTLTVIDLAKKIIQKKTNKYFSLKSKEFNLSDKKSFLNLQKANTVGIFQLESYGIKKLIKKFCPNCFQDIIILLALFRPGPLQSGMVENYINRKNKKEKVYYPEKNWNSNLLKPILKDTYGIIVFQEQVMKIAQTVAGYTLSRADILRRAISKKDKKIMQKESIFFQKGAKNLGIEKLFSKRIFELLEKFAGYGFNKSHSTAYAYISYQTLWLKSNYPKEFLVSVMNSEIQNTKKIVSLIENCKEMDITVLPPDINKSHYFFDITKNKEIIFGLGAIKGIGKSSAKIIIEERKKNGFYSSIFNFCERTNMKKITKKTLEQLIFSGAFDTFKKNRLELINSIRFAICYANQKNKSMLSKQKEMFPINENNLYFPIVRINHTDFWSESKKLKYEKLSTGMYLTGHPLKFFLEEIKIYTKKNEIKKKKILFGIIEFIRKKWNSYREEFYFIKIDTFLSKKSIFISKKKYNNYQNFIKKGIILAIYHKSQKIEKNNSKIFLCDKITTLEKIREKYLKEIRITFVKNRKKESIYFLKNFLKDFVSGKTKISFIDQQNFCTFKKFVSKKNYSIQVTNSLLENIFIAFGKKNVEMIFK